jgi:hypothetical protein
MLEFFFYLAVLCANTATAYPTPIQQIQQSQRQPAIHILSRHVNNTIPSTNTTSLPNIDRNPLTQARRDNPSQHAWAYFVAKLLAGLAGLIAIMIIIFWVHRRNVRSRRRRLGVMMGLGIKRDEVLRGKKGGGGKVEDVVGEGKRKRGSHVWKKSAEQKREKGKGEVERSMM